MGTPKGRREFRKRCLRGRRRVLCRRLHKHSNQALEKGAAQALEKGVAQALEIKHSKGAAQAFKKDTWK
ncbi:hypothetical protein GJ744_009658 [Endocarpon pusillum]|uniref:Uncharacterized protein n=1 Tax=Endocarpon pusillum TaxID=364733 RepID=A0A8H7E603_9EURO|nr:hypothetical protein GJ744_009658 [Endocarpon pusillum]